MSVELNLRQKFRDILRALPKAELRGKKGLRFVVSDNIYAMYKDQLQDCRVTTGDTPGCCFEWPPQLYYAGVLIMRTPNMPDDNIFTVRVVDRKVIDRAVVA